MLCYARLKQQHHNDFVKAANSMNKKRNNFIKSPNQNIKMTPYWLLGLIEGEGSFFVTKKNLTQHF
jgi:hypothetical protein